MGKTLGKTHFSPKLPRSSSRQDSQACYILGRLTAHVAMNAVVICTKGKVQAQMNGKQMELHKNQVAIVPQNVTVTDVMVSPDFNLKAMFLTNRILQSFLREKMNIWNDMMYIRRHHIVTMDEDEMLFYTHFYDMLTLAITKGEDYPLKTDVIQSLLRSAILGLCGRMEKMLASDTNLEAFFSGANVQNKPAAAVAICRRGGATAAYQTLNMIFEMMNMPVVTSQYWNIAYGLAPGEVTQDTEGMQTMRTLANNMAWLLKKIHADDDPDYPEREPWQGMNFIR